MLADTAALPLSSAGERSDPSSRSRTPPRARARGRAGAISPIDHRWFLDKTGHEGLNNLLAAYPDKSAYAQCIFAFCAGPGEEVHTFAGRTPGTIVPARGPTDFGWDPVFQPEGYDVTYAEMDKAEKNKISHRYRSLAALQKFLQDTPEAARGIKRPAGAEETTTDTA